MVVVASGVGEGNNGTSGSNSGNTLSSGGGGRCGSIMPLGGGSYGSCFVGGSGGGVCR